MCKKADKICLALHLLLIYLFSTGAYAGCGVPPVSISQIFFIISVIKCTSLFCCLNIN